MTRYMPRAVWAVMTMMVVFALAIADVRRPTEVIWVDRDTEDINEPRERGSSYYHYILETNFVEQPQSALDLPRLVRKVAGRPKQARNVNAMDEVPNSSWYTNRHHL